MARYTGPRLKIVRALGIELPGLTRKTPNRDYGPGQHGMKPKRKSGFGIQLMEKQKLRYNYGVSARSAPVPRSEEQPGTDRQQAARTAGAAARQRGFRAGFAPTTVAARQLVSHRHVRLNGKPVTIASIRVRSGDTITLSEKGRKIPMVIECTGEPSLSRPEWIAFDDVQAMATVTRLPDANEVPFPIEVQHVVEYYAVRL